MVAVKVETPTIPSLFSDPIASAGDELAPTGEGEPRFGGRVEEEAEAEESLGSTVAIFVAGKLVTSNDVTPLTTSFVRLAVISFRPFLMTWSTWLTRSGRGNELKVERNRFTKSLYWSSCFILSRDVWSKDSRMRTSS